MMNWIYYLLEANFYLILFYGFYRLCLHKETFYGLNRYYLIISSLAAFLIPFLQLGFLSKETVITNPPIYQNIHTEASLLNMENALLFVYTLIAFIFISKMFWGFRFILKLLKKPEKIFKNGIIIIELEHSKTAFSFFNMLFIDPELPEKDTIIRHEMVHIYQKHSLDILFFELIRSFNWFNPIAHLLKNDIKLVHEYLADEETTKRGIEKYEYALFLIQNSYGSRTVQLTNQIFNSSILKRRINMLNQKKSAKWARLRLLLVLPLVGGMLYTSTMAFTKSYGVLDIYPKKITGLRIQLQDTVKKAKKKEILIVEPVSKSNQVKRVKFAEPLLPPPAEPAPKTKNKKKSIASPVPSPAARVKGIEITTPPTSPTEPKAARVKGVEITSPPSTPVEPKAASVRGVEITTPPPPPVEPYETRKDLKEKIVVGYPTKGIAIHEPKTTTTKKEVVVLGYKVEKNKTVPIKKIDN